jgi:hypothetical protein
MAPKLQETARTKALDAERWSRRSVHCAAEAAGRATGGIANLDGACEISQKRDWRDLFVTPFLFRLRGR